MDCDGEDKPSDIPDLLNELRRQEKVVVAKRIDRQESRSFKFFYRIYKLAFFLLTGKKISFGNFMAIPRKNVNTLVYCSEVWSHLAGAIIKSKIPYSKLEFKRGKRYKGNSKMNFMSLLLHGLEAISVFIDIMAIRLLIFSLFTIAASIVAIAIILFIKTFTTKAIPGWATTAVLSMIIVLMQSFLLSLFTIFLYLTFKSQRQFIPAYHYMDYVRSIEKSDNE
jgi:hypothetical protein